MGSQGSSCDAEFLSRQWQQRVMCGRRRLGKNFLSCCSIGRVRSCVRPVLCGGEAAGHNALRGSGPNQKHAFKDALTQTRVLPIPGSTLSALRRHVLANSFKLQTPSSLPGLTSLNRSGFDANQSIALRCRRVGAVHSIRSGHHALTWQCPLCRRKRTPLQRAIEPFPLPARPMNREPVPGVGPERRFGWGIMYPSAASAALPLDHVADSQRYERSSDKRSKSRRFRMPALANSILGLFVLALLFVLLYGPDKLVETVSPGYMCNQSAPEAIKVVRRDAVGLLSFGDWYATRAITLNVPTPLLLSIFKMDTATNRKVGRVTYCTGI